MGPWLGPQCVSECRVPAQAAGLRASSLIGLLLCKPQFPHLGGFVKCAGMVCVPLDGAWHIVKWWW